MDNESSSTSQVDLTDEGGVGGPNTGRVSHEQEKDNKVAKGAEGLLQELNSLALLQDEEEGVDDHDEDDDERLSLSSEMSDPEINISEHGEESEEIKRLKSEIQRKQMEIDNLRHRAQSFDYHAKMDIKFDCAHDNLVYSFADLVAECEVCCEPLTGVNYVDMDFQCH
ncbi:uncharacterized protein [Diadema antillarum]|uniref:uncharacterized protein n=1 Tax=Diadema antillarum TaxID=105358 RepID=UPI003A882E05